jgi:hypothetical protein
MSNFEEQLVGLWKGESRLYLNWLPVKEYASRSTMRVRTVGDGSFLHVQYDWRHEGRKHEGLLIVAKATGKNKKEQVLTAAWVDSWHQRASVMHCKGAADSRDRFHVTGSYSAGDGPDWGWRITLRLRRNGELLMEMNNIDPDGKSDLAVRATYQRG